MKLNSTQVLVEVEVRVELGNISELGRISKSVSFYLSFFITNFKHLTMFLAFQLSCQPHKKTRSMQHYSKAVTTTQS